MEACLEYIKPDLTPPIAIQAENYRAVQWYRQARGAVDVNVGGEFAGTGVEASETRTADQIQEESEKLLERRSRKGILLVEGSSSEVLVIRPWSENWIRREWFVFSLGSCCTQGVWYEPIAGSRLAAVRLAS